MTPIDPIVRELWIAQLGRAAAKKGTYATIESVGDIIDQEVATGNEPARALVHIAARIRAIILAEERAKPAAQRWAEMGDEEVAAMAKEMPAVASAWELIDEGDGLHVRRAYCVESSLLFASSRDEMRDVDSSNCGYRLIGGIPDAAPDAGVR